MNVHVKGMPSARFVARARQAATAEKLPQKWGDMIAESIGDTAKFATAAKELAAMASHAKPYSDGMSEADLDRVAKDVLVKINGGAEGAGEGGLAGEALISLLAARDRESGPIYPMSEQATLGHSWDHGEGLVARMTDGFLARIDPTHKPTMGRDFAHATNAEMARAVLDANGVRPRSNSAAAVIEMALHSTVDFPIILGGVVGTVVRNAYEAAESGMKKLSREITATNFRTIHSIGISSGPDLEKVLEGGEFTRGTITEGDESLSLSTFGKVFGITRQALVNDDMGVFSNMAPIMGRGAANAEAKVFAALLEQNGGAGPKMGDGEVLFHADHGNLAATAAALGEASLNAARVAMRRQKGLGGEAINVTPAYLLVPPELETEAEKIIATITAADSSKVNAFSGKLTPVVDAYLSDPARWYITGQPGMPDTLQHAYLNGMSGPQVFTREGFDVDGMEFKVRLDFGAGFVDYRGWYMNAGA